MNIGIIREGKNPPDKRTALSPKQCSEVMAKYPAIKIYVQPSPFRCFKDEEYAAQGCLITENIEHCDILFGIKEVPILQLVANKTYLFFSHTIKKQPYNRKLLQNILAKNINLLDYETLKNPKGERIVAFGRYAGLVGAYNAILIYGKKHNLFEIKPAHTLFDRIAMQAELEKVKLPPIRIAVTGNGRVTRGAVEILEVLGVQKISVEEYLQIADNQVLTKPVYVQLRSADYHKHRLGKNFGEDFYTNPENYESDFLKFAHKTDMLIATAYWNPKAPKLFADQDTKAANFRIEIIADVTCDINGSIPCTQKASTILEPVYDYDRQTATLAAPFSNPAHINVMAVDNLPCEMPRDASVDFGKDLIDRVLPSLLGEDKDKIIANALVAKNGVLQPNFMYLEDYVMEVA